MPNLDRLNDTLMQSHVGAWATSERNCVHITGINPFDVPEQWLGAVSEIVRRTLPALVYTDSRSESAGQTGGLTRMHAWFQEPSATN